MIPSEGIAITGQEQRQLGGGFLEGKDSPKGTNKLRNEKHVLAGCIQIIDRQAFTC